MKALILDGCKKDNIESAKIQDSMNKELQKLNWDTKFIILEDVDLAYCAGCFGCWIQTPGECIIKDYQEIIVREMVHCDLIIYITPITFGGYSSILKETLDRQISRVLPYFMKINGEVHHSKRYEKQQSLIAVGILDKPDDEKEDVFKTLVARNAINMWSPYQKAIIFAIDQDITEFCNNFNESIVEVEKIL
ncbi:MAG: flavodoxin family protein [Promethearchaeota archaeon]